MGQRIQTRRDLSGWVARPRLGLAVVFAALSCLAAVPGAEGGLAAAKAVAHASTDGTCSSRQSQVARQRCQIRAARRHRGGERFAQGNVSPASQVSASATNAAPSATPVVPGSPPGEAVSEAVSVGGSSCTATSFAAGFGSFSSRSQPSGCWRPYASSSPFNTPVGPSAEATPGSAQQVARLLSGGAISHFVAGDTAKDFGTAVYYPSQTDPTYTIHCTEAWGRCDLEGQQIHLPEGATPSGVWPIGNGDSDSHLTVVDQASGWEYDLWNVRSIESGRIVVKWGGKTRIDGEGLDSDAVAARFGSLGGIIRPQELQSGVIDHALALTIPCTAGFVAPATKGGLECGEAGMSSANSLPMGAHLQLQLSSAQIQAMNVPTWKKAILQALSTYGAYVEDTTGDASQWGLKWESAASQTSVGGSDGFVALAKSLDMQPEDYNGNGQSEYWFDIASGVDWSQLRVIS